MNNFIKECCPKFDVNEWDRRRLHWDDKKFVKDSISTFFHFSLPFVTGRRIKKIWKTIEKANAVESNRENTLILFRDISAFKTEIYISVAKNVLGMDNVFISGDFISRIFDGKPRQIPKFIEEMNQCLTEIKESAKDYYVHYVYCPKCARKFKHNYLILFAKIK